jgi:WD40 repeat protein
MIKKILSFVLICLFLVGAVSCDGETSPSPTTTDESPPASQESKPATTSTDPTQSIPAGSPTVPKEEKTGPPPGELLRLGDFSIAISEIDREDNKAILYFAITKVADKEPVPLPLPVILIDDHKNEYRSQLAINTEMKAILKLIPKDFVYVETVEISIPKAAPIEKIILGEKERNYKDIKFGVPQYLKDFGNAAVTKGKGVQVGSWLTYIMDNIEPALRQWELAIHFENADYNSLPVEAKIGSQLDNGTISWASSTINVPDKSKSLEKLPLAIPSWIDDEPPYPRALLLLIRDKKAGEQVLKLYSMASGELPPLVGQGPKEVEDRFVAAYQAKGGQEAMGNPTGIPRWLAGGNSPKDDGDLLMQEFPAVSQLGKSVIIWDKQSNASRAYIISGKVWETYLGVGGSASWLGYPIGKESVSTKGHPLVDFEKGYIGTPDGVSFVAYEYATGRIAFSSGTKICAVNVDGSELTSLKAGMHPKWSPDGTRIAYVAWTGWEIGVMNSDGSNPQSVVPRPGNGTYDAVDWSPDGRRLVFSNPSSTAFSIKEAIWIANHDGSELKKLTNGSLPSWSPDGTVIAFQRDGFIHLITPDGANEQKLASGTKPSWSPDGQKIVFVAGSGQKEIFEMNRDGSGVTLLLTHTALVESVSYSPDGRWLTFSSNRQAYLFGPGNRLTKLETDGNAMWPSWREP